MVLAVGLTLLLPEVLVLLVQPAVQEVALLEDQLSVLLAPLLIDEGLALRLTVGAGALVTVTVVEWLVVPAAPVQVRV